MKNKFLKQIAATVILSGVAFLASAKPSKAATTFVCQAAGSGWATVVSNGQNSTVLMTWNSQNFSASGYTPEQRCRAVTGRLTSYVAQLGKGKLSGLLLTTGFVNGLPVICVVNQMSGCTQSNILVTLSGQNATNPGKALSNITNTAKYGTNVSGSPLQERRGRVFISLEKLVNQALGSLNNEIPIRNNTVSPIPSNTPIPRNNPVPSNNSQPSTPGGVF